jgi:hypothetical protein
MFSIEKAQDLLKMYLLSIGICASNIKVVSRSESHYCAQIKIVPSLDIYVCTNENYLSLNLDKEKKNGDSSFVHTNEIRQKWFETLEQDDIKEYYDQDMYIIFRNEEMVLLIDTVYSFRNEIISLLSSLNIIKPQYIYCCSSPNPGYNIIYHDKNDYNNAETRDNFTLIGKVIIDFILEKFPKDKSNFIKESVRIKFYHPEMQGFNYYGFSRQD